MDQSLLGLALAGSRGLLESFPFSVPFSFPVAFSFFSDDGEESAEELLLVSVDFFA
jgi:hypothetical protein